MKKGLFFLSALVLSFFCVSKAQGQLTAHFGATPVSGCSPIVVQFTDSSTGGAVSWQWNLGNGTVSTLQNPSKTYTLPGTYPITLKVTDAAGNTNTKTISNFITVIPKPVVNFSASDSMPGCAPKTVTFVPAVVAGVPGAPTYTWDFGDGTLSNSAVPTHTYAGGIYDVTLSVTNAQGCNSVLTKMAYIKASSKPTASFTFSGNNTCTLPATVTFGNTTNASVGATYQWNFGNGQTATTANPTATYTTAGTYAVRLIATVPGGGCADTFTQNVVVTATPPVAGFTAPLTACAGTPVSFANTTTPLPAASTWDFGDGTGSGALLPAKTYAAAGTYTVRLIVQSGNCADTITKTIVITGSPLAAFSTNPSPATGCSVPQTFSFTNSTTGAGTYSWNFGDGTSSTALNPSKTYTAFGNYSVTLTATGTNGCTATSAAQTISLLPPTLSVAAAYPTGSCAPAGISFSSSFSAAGGSTTYAWTFGDGTTGTGAAPGHTYASAGSYTATLVATNASGCTATAAVTVNIGSKPTAAFTATPLTTCTDVPVAFSNTSAGGTTYQWSFGDGATSTALNPTHAYGAPGTYTVTLIASNNGCNDTLVRTAYINVAGPVADFTDNFLCSNKALHTFINTSVGATSYEWDFGDGAVSTAVSPSHVYTTTGSFLVQLKAINGVCTTTVAKRIYIYNVNTQFTGAPLPVCKGTAVVFTLQNSTYIKTAAWNFGDGTNAPAALPGVISKVYNTAGTYTVSLYVTDSAGCADTLIKPAYVTVRGPMAGFKALPTAGCLGALIQFTDTTTVAGGNLVSRTWNFGDGTILSGNNATPSNTYAAAGIYSVSLKVTDNNGCTDSLLRPAYINLTKPVAGFTTANTNPCSALTKTFTNTSTGGLSYNWNFGDGTTSAAFSPVKTYAATGTYMVRLITTAASGCTDTVTLPLSISAGNLFASFTVSDSVAACPPLAVQFTPAAPAGTTYFWRFGNGATATSASPSALYSTAGIYIAKLIATSANGCVDSAFKTIVVNGPAGTVSYSPATGCAPVAVTFLVNATNAYAYTYDFDNGVTQTIASNTYTYTYTAGGNFKPVVILSNGAGCNVAVEATDTLKISSLKAGFTNSASNLCPGAFAQFADTSVVVGKAPLTRLWSFGDGTTDTAASVSKTYLAPGSYSVKLLLSNGVCTDSLVKTITVLPAPTLLLSPSGTICPGGSAGLNASGAATYLWSPGATLSCTTCATPTATPAATTTYTVVGTASSGCTDTAQVAVVVAPSPVVSTGPDKTICPGNTTQLSATGAATYVWSPATGLSCTTCPNPTASPASTTTYVVTGTSAAGCSRTDTIVVTVNPSLVLATNGPAKSICAGGSVGLTVSGASSYVWSPATGLSCTTCPNPTASPAGTTTYTITGTSAAGCPGTATISVTVNPVPVVNVLPNPAAVCAGGSVPLLVTGAATYAWSPAAGLSCTTCPNPTASPASTTGYNVTGTSAVGCTATVLVPVVVNPLPAVTATASQNSPCAGVPVTLTASGAATYVWSPATGLSCTACASPTAAVNTATTYVVTGTTAAGCSNTAQVTINPKPKPVLTAMPAAICAGGSTPLLVSGAENYVWSPAAGLSCTNCPNPTASPATTTTYTITGTGANGCATTATLLVTVNPLPAVSAGPNREVCAGTPVLLNATGATSYVWSPAAGLSCTACTSPTATLSNTTTYTVTGTSAAGCVGSAQITLSVVPRAVVSVEPPKPICIGESVQLRASGGTSYLWSPAGSLSNATAAAPVATPEQTTTYTVVIKQGNCYTDTLRAQVVVLPLPTVNAGSDKTVIAGSSTQLVATTTGASSFSWSPPATLSCTDCISPLATPLETTTYTITVTTDAGCSATDDVTLRVQCDNSQLFLPNTFTPNGDGANDVFFPRGKGVREVRSFRVYSRWGELLFSAENLQPNDETRGWNGSFKGVPLKPDVYVWIIDALCDAGVPLQLKGDVSILK